MDKGEKEAKEQMKDVRKPMKEDPKEADGSQEDVISHENLAFK